MPTILKAERHNSLFVYAVAFAAGCGIGTYGEVTEGVWRWLLPCAVGLCLISVGAAIMTRIRLRRVTTAIAVATAALLGITAYDLRNPAYQESNYINHIEGATETLFVAEIKSEPQRTPKRLKTTVEVTAIQSGDSLLQTTGKAVIYFDTLDTWVAPGIRITALGEFQPLPYSIGANHFRYRQYMQRKGIQSQCFTRGIEPIESSISPTLRVRRWRNRLCDIVSSSSLSPQKQGIARALVLGDREAPQEITKEEFSAAGLSHLLCVSGLHVGIVALLVGLMFMPFGTKRRTLVLKGVAELAAVWLFVVMTGMAPATLRAGVMFSFLIAGRLFTDRPVSLNALGLSAITLLIIRPTMIADIGFQLSYTAVTGILVFYKPLFNLLPINRLYQTDEYDSSKQTKRSKALRQLKKSCLYMTNKGVDLLWKSIVLCTVAQVCIMPLQLYYFHQITPWFMIANVLIVPFTGVLLGSIMLMMTVSGWPWAWQAMQSVVDWELGLLCGITHRVSTLPGAIIEDVDFTFPMLFVSFLILSVVGIMIHRWFQMNTV